MSEAYAKRVRSDDGTFRVETPSRGFCMIEGVDEHLAARITEVINRAYERGQEEVQSNLRAWLGVKECDHD